MKDKKRGGVAPHRGGVQILDAAARVDTANQGAVAMASDSPMGPNFAAGRDGALDVPQTNGSVAYTADNLSNNSNVLAPEPQMESEKHSRIFNLFKRFTGAPDREDASSASGGEVDASGSAIGVDWVRGEDFIQLRENAMENNEATSGETNGSDGHHSGNFDGQQIAPGAARMDNGGTAGTRSIDISARRAHPQTDEADQAGDSRRGLRHAVTGRTDVRDISSLNFEAVKLCSVKVQVTHRGSPLGGVEVEARQFGRKLTNASGTATLDDIDERSEVRITFNRSKFVFDPPSISFTVSDKHVVSIGALELFTLGGTVLHRGKGVSDVLVSVPGIGETVTDESGVFRFNDVVEGTAYHVEIRKAHYRFESAAASGVVGEDTNLRFDATKLVTVSGVVTYQGQPVEGVVVDGGPLGLARTDVDGRYSFTDIPEGTDYTISLSKEGYRFQAQQGVA